MNTFLLVCVIVEVLCLGVYYQSRMPTYQFRSLQNEEEGTKKVVYYEVYRNGRRQSCTQMVKRLDEPAFLRELTIFFETHPHTAGGQFFFFMCTPIQANFLNRPFTFFVITDTGIFSQWLKALDGLPTGSHASFERYKEYVEDACNPESSSKVMAFRSKQEPSTVLVSPCPNPLKPESSQYGFLGDFLRNATMTEKIRYFRKIKLEIQLHLMSIKGKRGVPLFMSTHGLDVPWLHMRLETPLPKHYNDFKKWYDLLP